MTKNISKQIEALRRAAGLPAGRVLTVSDIQERERCGRRHADHIMESGELAYFVHGKRKLTTDAAYEDFTRQRMAKWLHHLETEMQQEGVD